MVEWVAGVVGAVAGGAVGAVLGWGLSEVSRRRQAKEQAQDRHANLMGAMRDELRVNMVSLYVNAGQVCTQFYQRHQGRPFYQPPFPFVFDTWNNLRLNHPSRLYMSKNVSQLCNGFNIHLQQLESILNRREELKPGVIAGTIHPELLDEYDFLANNACMSLMEIADKFGETLTSAVKAEEMTATKELCQLLAMENGLHQTSAKELLAQLKPIYLPQEESPTPRVGQGQDGAEG